MTTPDPRSGTQPDPRSGTQPNPRSGTQPNPRSGTQPNPRSGTQPNPRSGTQPYQFNAVSDDGSLLCHGCAAAGACRFGIRDVRPDDDGVRAAVICTTAFEGAPGMAHGGWIAAVLDEITGFLTIHRAGFAVTASLRIDFKRPVPLDEPLTLLARAESSNDGRWHVHGELRHTESDALLASAGAVYALRDARYFARDDTS